jgi:hypothetical protein
MTVITCPHTTLLAALTIPLVILWRLSLTKQQHAKRLRIITCVEALATCRLPSHIRCLLIMPDVNETYGLSFLHAYL